MIDPQDTRIDLLHRLKGCQALLIIAFLLFPERSLRYSDLVQVTGKSKPTILDGLRNLADLGIIQKHAGSGWTLAARIRQLILGQGPGGQESPAPLPESPNAGPESPAVSLESPTEGKNFLPPPSSSSYLDPDTETQKQEPTTSSGGQKTLPSPEIVASLTKAGVYHSKALALATDPWLTLDIIDDWLDALEADETVGSVPAVLCYHLERRQDPPAPPLTDHELWLEKFRKDPYAHCVES